MVSEKFNSSVHVLGFIWYLMGFSGRWKLYFCYTTSFHVWHCLAPHGTGAKHGKVQVTSHQRPWSWSPCIIGDYRIHWNIGSRSITFNLMCRFSCADSLFSVKTRLFVSRFEIESGRRVETATAAWRSLVHDGLIDGRFTVLLVVVCGVLTRKLKHACVSKRLSLGFLGCCSFLCFVF